MDPVEDNPSRTMEDYLGNYERTLAASLMFPEVDRFEVMPWPTRIFGRVPDDFATLGTSATFAVTDPSGELRLPLPGFASAVPFFVQAVTLSPDPGYAPGSFTNAVRLF